MRRSIPLVLSLLFVMVCAPIQAQERADSGRKVVSKVMPAYPTMARDIGIRGTAKLEVLVSPNGSVKTIRPTGGHPLLVQAATKAVNSWRWEPTPRESTENVEVRFGAE